ncbi:MAG: MFS transporter, partial [Priestia megaterium]
FFVYTSLQIPMGILADRFGPNFFLIIGATLTGFGTVIYSLGTHDWILFIARILTGVGDATIWVNMMLILATWFHRKEFVRLVGFAGMTGSLGFLLATVPYSMWISLYGWRATFFSIGLLLCFCGLFLYFVLVKNTKRRFEEQPVVEKVAVQREKTMVIVRKVFSNRQSWALFFCHFGVVGGYVGFISSWAVPYMTNLYEMTSSEASQLIMLGLIGALIGAPLMSWISSSLETIRKPYIMVHTIVLLSWCTFLLVNGHPSLSLLSLLFFIIGFGYGASALSFAAVRQSFSIKENGIVSGFVNTGGFLSAVLLPILFGYILDYFHLTAGNLADGYYYGFITPVIFSVMGIIGIFCYKENKIKLKMNR